MRNWIRQKMRNTKPFVFHNRPNKLAIGITCGLYTNTQKCKFNKTASLFSELSDYHILGLYGTLDKLAKFSKIFFKTSPKVCACCGHRTQVLSGLSNAGKARLQRLRTERLRRL